MGKPSFDGAFRGAARPAFFWQIVQGFRAFQKRPHLLQITERRIPPLPRISHQFKGGSAPFQHVLAAMGAEPDEIAHDGQWQMWRQFGGRIKLILCKQLVDDVFRFLLNAFAHRGQRLRG